MRSHRIVEHVADVRARVQGSTLPELFRAALEVMNEIADPRRDDSAAALTEMVSLTAPDTTVLLIDFLSEALTRGHIRQGVFHRVEFSTLTDCTLEARLEGFGVARLVKDIKAVTYHEADVRENAEGRFETTIVFDI
jgi:SHS2 domain-containing protein